MELPIRIGISLGDVTIEAGDVFGTTVIEALRLCAAANGGQILATGVVATLARGRGGHTFTDAGALDLKGLPDPVPVAEVGWERVRVTRPWGERSFYIVDPWDNDLCFCENGTLYT